MINPAVLNPILYGSVQAGPICASEGGGDPQPIPGDQAHTQYCHSQVSYSAQHILGII
jgi:hypothetical protein